MTNRPAVYLSNTGLPIAARPKVAEFVGAATQTGTIADQLASQENPSATTPPSGLVLATGTSFNHAYIDVSWTTVASEGIKQFEVRVERDNDGIVSTVRTAELSTRIEPVLSNSTYTIFVYNIMLSGVLGTYSSATVVAAADTTIPVVPVGMTVGAGLRTLTASWTDNTEPDVAFGMGRYRVQVSTDVGFVTLIYDKEISGTIVSVTDLSPSTQYWIRISAKDTSNNQSPFTASATVTTIQTSTADIGAGSVGTAAIVDAAVSGIKIGVAAVGTTNIVNAAITNTKIGNAAVENIHIANAAVDTAQIVNLAVDSTKIANAAVGNAQIGNAQITDAKIISLTASKITAGTISGQLIILSGASGIFRSDIYVAGVSGFLLDGAGNFEANTGTFGGALSAATGTFFGDISVGPNLPTAGRVRIYSSDTISGLSGTQAVMLLGDGACFYVDDPATPERATQVRSRPTDIGGYTANLILRQLAGGNDTAAFLSADHNTGTGTGASSLSASSPAGGANFTGLVKLDSTGAIIQWADYASTTWSYMQATGGAANIAATGPVVIQAGTTIALNAPSHVYIGYRRAYFGVPGNTDYIQYDPGGTTFGTFIGGNIRHQISPTRTYISANTIASGFASEPLLISDGSGLALAGMGLWNSATSTAVIWRCSGAGNYLVARDSTDALYVPILASAFTISSTRAEKTKITPAPVGALDLIRRLPIVQYRRLIDAHPTSAWSDDDDPDKIAAAKTKRLAAATSQDWAQLAAQQTGPEFIETGIIVDDLDPVDAHRICRHEADDTGVMRPTGVDLGSMVATLTQAVQTLADMIDPPDKPRS